MAPFRKTAFWGALACLVVLVALVIWWSPGDDKERSVSSAIDKQEAVGLTPQEELRQPLEEQIGLESLFSQERGPRAEKTWELKEVEEAVRRTFLAYNRQDLSAFKAGWTDKGFQQAYEIPKEKARHFGQLGLLSFRPYVIGEFSNTWVNEKTAATELGLTHGEVQETHRLALVREDDEWKIDHDEKLALIPQEATVVDAKLDFFNIQLDRTRLAPGPVAFKIINTDTRPHEFIVKKQIAASGMEETIGMTKQIEPGENATLLLANLTPGAYVVLCNLVGRDTMPYSYGMRTEFVVD